jgi:hypothetical protein
LQSRAALHSWCAFMARILGLHARFAAQQLSGAKHRCVRPGNLATTPATVRQNLRF